MDAAKSSQADSKVDGLTGLHSDKSIKRLEQIASLRARGCSNNIDLPQLVVCGDQSAGKSSVLEGLSQIPFPRDEGVCTKFPTEVILEHSEETQAITATIIPHVSRKGTTKSRLEDFNRKIDDFKQLPNVIAEAGALMGIRGYGLNLTGPAFVEDVLRIKYTGPTGLHLSIVDLPGLISTASDEQTETDVETVQSMVTSYIERPRTIILAVVQAGNDIANQSIIKKSKHFDQAGRRTVGVITKPDLINKGAEVGIAALAKNEATTKLHLGFFMLKNPTPEDRQNGMTAAQRSANELRYFQSSPWREQNLITNQVGIGKLKDFLQTLLDKHIEAELPKVREEIKAMIKTTENQLARMPTERPTAAHLRMFLSDLAMKYHNLAMCAVNGDYDTTHADFFASRGKHIGTTRLRALVHKMNTEFSDQMRYQGKTLVLSETPEPAAADLGNNQPSSEEPLESSEDADFDEDELKSDENANDDSGDGSSGNDATEDGDSGPRHVSETELMNWVKKIYVKSRGRELSGNSNPTLLVQLFHYQSKSWPRIASEHVERVYTAIDKFVKRVLKYLQVEDHVLAEMQESMTAKLHESKESAEAEMKKLILDEQQQPITYNHYYTDTVQNTRVDTFQNAITEAQRTLDAGDVAIDKFGRTTADLVCAGLKKQIVVDMEEQACSEALATLNAYHKVARKTFVDNVCRQVIERHLVRSLPEIFSPQVVAAYTDDDLERIAGERPEVVEKRKSLQEHLKNLKAGLNDLRK